MSREIFVAAAIFTIVWDVVAIVFAVGCLVRVWSAPTDARRGGAALLGALALATVWRVFGDNAWMNLVPATALAMGILALVFFTRAAVMRGRGAA